MLNAVSILNWIFLRYGYMFNHSILERVFFKPELLQWYSW